MTVKMFGRFVSTHSRPKAAGLTGWVGAHLHSVSTHSRPKAAGPSLAAYPAPCAVSTHSRPKAAGDGSSLMRQLAEVSTHSRPKAAGCSCPLLYLTTPSFNTQPPEGGWFTVDTRQNRVGVFQHTAARRRLGELGAVRQDPAHVSTHSRPKAAGLVLQHRRPSERVSTHSRPKAAGAQSFLKKPPHTFQHTAARRRLVDSG